MFVVGMGFALGNGQLSGHLFSLGVAAMLREWCFGFPNLILDPKLEPPIEKVDSNSELIGCQGTVVSQMRPTGATIDKKHMQTRTESRQRKPVTE